MPLIPNIAASVALSTGSQVDSPFSDDTYIQFPGATLSSWQPVNVAPEQSTSATATAALGNASAEPVSTVGGATPSAAQSSGLLGGINPVYLLVGAAVVFLIFKHHKIL